MLIHFIFGILFLSLFVFGQESKNVYFIGISYTAIGNIPNLIKQIANSSGDELIYTAHTPGGATLQQHASKPTVANTIQKEIGIMWFCKNKVNFPPFQMNNSTRWFYPLQKN